MPAVITLTTDFGLDDPYVGIMHAVIAERCPTARVIDFCHAVQPQSVIHGGLLLRQSWRFAPAGSVHVAVIDPGVGSGRAVLVAAAAGHVFVLPDNGLLSLAVETDEIEAVHRLARTDWFVQPVSSTFHGRDIFAPTAAALAAGASVADTGPAFDAWQRRSIPAAIEVAGGWQGEVIYVDHFGNAVTNLEAGLAARAEAIQAGGVAYPLVQTYADVGDGEPLAVVGSGGWLEASIRNGSTRLITGEKVLLRANMGP